MILILPKSMWSTTLILTISVSCANYLNWVLILHLFTLQVIISSGMGWFSKYWISVVDADQYHIRFPGILLINTLGLRQNGWHFADNIFLNENVWILIKISSKFIPWHQNNNIPTLVQIMAWHWSGDKPLSEPMMVKLLTHMCVTWPQWVNGLRMLISQWCSYYLYWNQFRT